ncbi:MAG: calcium-binding protein [Gemmobacter sp.]
MLISREIWEVSTGIELVRSGNDVTFYLAGSASGYFDPDLGYWEWYGYMELIFGPDSNYFEQYFDRPMDLSLTQTLESGVAVTGSYFVEGSYSINGSGSFSVLLFDTATTYGGTSGIDFVFGSASVDRLSGSAGDDGLDGGAGNDWLNGGAGRDHIEGGAGRDTASYAGATAAVVARLYNGLLGEGDAAGDRYVSVENLEGSGFNDHLYGDNRNNTIWGRDGVDALFGLKGNDVLEGGRGADMLFGDVGSDTASYAGSTTGVVASLTTGTGTAGDAAGDAYNGIENLAGSAFDDQLAGDAAANVLRGAAGNDVLRGGAGDDALSGGNGDDLLLGGAGADRLDGGLGTDTVSYAGAAAGVVANLAASSGNTQDAAGDVYVSVENLSGTSYDDSLTGNAFENYVAGGNGNDTVNGGDASDRLRGGAGSDAFVFDSALGALSNVDVLLDYSVADDGIRLDDAVFAELTAGQGLGAAFVIGSAATTADHRIIYNAANGGLSYDADGTGEADAILFARIGAGLAMTEAEFLMV